MLDVELDIKKGKAYDRFSKFEKLWGSKHISGVWLASFWHMVGRMGLSRGSSSSAVVSVLLGLERPLGIAAF